MKHEIFLKLPFQKKIESLMSEINDLFGIEGFWKLNNKVDNHRNDTFMLFCKGDDETYRDFTYNKVTNILSFKVYSESKLTENLMDVLKLTNDNLIKVIEDYNLSNVFSIKDIKSFNILQNGLDFVFVNFFETTSSRGSFYERGFTCTSCLIYQDKCSSLYSLSKKRFNTVISYNKYPFFDLSVETQFCIECKNHRLPTLQAKRHLLKKDNYYKMFEDSFYDLIFKDIYSIKRKTRKELDLIKIIRY